MLPYPDGADKRGYLNESYRLFHLSGRETDTIPYHYHEFHKLLLFLSGDLTYLVEGRKYTLRPGDVLLVPAHAIHQPIIAPEQPYDRIILWIRPEELERRGIEAAFSLCRQQNTYLLARELYEPARLKQLLLELERSLKNADFADDILSDALFLQANVLLCRWIRSARTELASRTAPSDPKIDEILSYINQNLTEDLSIDALSARFFLSRSRLMHRFKLVTGCPIHQYVLQKRLILAAQLLRSGVSVGEAAQRSGFSDYSSFLRSFRKAYHVSPGNYR